MLSVQFHSGKRTHLDRGPCPAHRPLPGRRRGIQDFNAFLQLPVTPGTIKGALRLALRYPFNRFERFVKNHALLF